MPMAEQPVTGQGVAAAPALGQAWALTGRPGPR